MSKGFSCHKNLLLQNTIVIATQFLQSRPIVLATLSAILGCVWLGSGAILCVAFFHRMHKERPEPSYFARNSAGNASLSWQDGCAEGLDCCKFIGGQVAQGEIQAAA